jgi:hypothetical protein
VLHATGSTQSPLGVALVPPRFSLPGANHTVSFPVRVPDDVEDVEKTVEGSLVRLRVARA